MQSDTDSELVAYARICKQTRELFAVRGIAVSQPRYRLFCPLAMASEVLCSRWTMMLLAELLDGTTRFNDLRRGLPRMSPALLSKRLKELEQEGVIIRTRASSGPDLFEYHLTEAGHALKPVIDGLGAWGHQWVSTQASLENLDAKLLMWNMRRNINPDPMPNRRSTIQFVYRDLPPEQRNWWLISQPGMDIDLCSVDPGYDVDLYVRTDLRSMTEAWMGYAPIDNAINEGRIMVVGEPELERTFKIWLGSSGYAKIEKRVA
jgi:DNA-binding HxlR family transcriptional regulator